MFLKINSKLSALIKVAEIQLKRIEVENQEKKCNCKKWRHLCNTCENKPVPHISYFGLKILTQHSMEQFAASFI